MTLPDDHLRYPHRRYGMDHKRYEWSILPRRSKVTWPNGARIAVWVVPALEWFPLNMSAQAVRIPGELDRPYPDYWNYTLRDYGNRVGYFRVANVLRDLGIKASVAMNSALAERHPVLVEDINEHGWEIIAHGVDMGRPHYGGLDLKTETALVEESVTSLRTASGQAVTGWLSPGKSESANTLDVIAAQGIQYVCDWVNDDMPYAMRSESGALYALPHSYETDDQLILSDAHHSEDQYLAQLKGQFETLYSESSANNGRVFCLSLHPWIIGQPFRIKMLERALSYVLSHAGVWSATGSEILTAFKASQQTL
jgi:allantoinase